MLNIKATSNKDWLTDGEELTNRVLKSKYQTINWGNEG